MYYIHILSIQRFTFFLFFLTGFLHFYVKNKELLLEMLGLVFPYFQNNPCNLKKDICILGLGGFVPRD